MRFSMRDKFSSFLILEKIVSIAYKFALLPALSNLHQKFYLSLLLKYVSNLEHVLDFAPSRLKEKLIYGEQPTRIVDRKD